MSDADKFHQQAIDAQKEGDDWVEKIEREKRESEQRMHDYSSKVKDYEGLARDENDRMQHAVQAGDEAQASTYKAEVDKHQHEVGYWQQKAQEEQEASRRRIEDYQRLYQQAKQKSAQLEGQAANAARDDKERKEQKRKQQAMQILASMNDNPNQ